MALKRDPIAFPKLDDEQVSALAKFATLKSFAQGETLFAARTRFQILRGEERPGCKAVEDLGDRGFASDGLESDDTGRLYLTDYEDNAILRRNADGGYETLAHDPRLLWPDTLSVAADGYLYIIANQLHRQAQFHGGKDLRRKPYALFRIRIDAQPVLLR